MMGGDDCSAVVLVEATRRCCGLLESRVFSVSGFSFIDVVESKWRDGKSCQNIGLRGTVGIGQPW